MHHKMVYVIATVCSLHICGITEFATSKLVSLVSSYIVQKLTLFVIIPPLIAGSIIRSLGLHCIIGTEE